MAVISQNPVTAQTDNDKNVQYDSRCITAQHQCNMWHAMQYLLQLMHHYNVS